MGGGIQANGLWRAHTTATCRRRIGAASAIVESRCVNSNWYLAQLSAGFTWAIHVTHRRRRRRRAIARNCARDLVLWWRRRCGRTGGRAGGARTSAGQIVCRARARARARRDPAGRPAGSPRGNAKLETREGTHARTIFRAHCRVINNLCACVPLARRSARRHSSWRPAGPKWARRAKTRAPAGGPGAAAGAGQHQSH